MTALVLFVCVDEELLSNGPEGGPVPLKGIPLGGPCRRSSWTGAESRVDGLAASSRPIATALHA